MVLAGRTLIDFDFDFEKFENTELFAAQRSIQSYFRLHDEVCRNWHVITYHFAHTTEERVSVSNWGGHDRNVERFPLLCHYHTLNLLREQLKLRFRNISTVIGYELRGRSSNKKFIGFEVDRTKQNRKPPLMYRRISPAHPVITHSGLPILEFLLRHIFSHTTSLFLSPIRAT